VHAITYHAPHARQDMHQTPAGKRQYIIIYTQYRNSTQNHAHSCSHSILHAATKVHGAIVMCVCKHCATVTQQCSSNPLAPTPPNCPNPTHRPTLPESPGTRCSTAPVYTSSEGGLQDGACKVSTVGVDRGVQTMLLEAKRAATYHKAPSGSPCTLPCALPHCSSGSPTISLPNGAFVVRLRSIWGS